jgi:hypothetical protein
MSQQTTVFLDWGRIWDQAQLHQVTSTAEHKQRAECQNRGAQNLPVGRSAMAPNQDDSCRVCVGAKQVRDRSI